MNTNHARNWQQTHKSPSPTEQQKKKVIVRVRNKSWLTKGEKVIYAFLSVLIILSGVYIVSFASSTDALNRNVQSLEQQIEQQQIENNGLVYKKQELSKPERITKIAKENGLKTQNTKVKRAGE